MIDKIVEKGVEEVVSELNADLYGRSILITGGSGFIGSWLCDILVRLGARVTCLDNLSSGRTANIDHLLSNNNFRFIKADVVEWIPRGEFDMIIHAASLPAPEHYIEKPVEAILPNTLGLMKLLEYARKTDSRILFTSTSEVYGDSSVIPTPESFWGCVNPIGPRSCYDESKRMAEALCMAYHRQYGVDVRIARIFNTYGPRLDPGAKYARVVSRFIMQALKNEPITVHGDGKQTRSFCYVTDTVACLIKMLIKENINGAVINVGNPQEITILELAKLIKRLTKSTSPIIFTSPRPDDPRRRCPSIDMAKKILGWEPKVSLKDGLKHTIEWFKSLMYDSSPGNIKPQSYNND